MIIAEVSYISSYAISMSFVVPTLSPIIKTKVEF